MKVVRVIGVKEYRDRHGKLRRYHRKTGERIALALAGAALAAEVARLDAKHITATIGTPEPVPGTLRAAVVKYKTEADHWKGLRARTRKDYERVFKWLGDDGLDMPLTDITAPEIAELRDKAKRAHERKFANQVLTTLKAVLQYGFEKGLVPANEAAGVQRAQPIKAEFDPDVDDDEDAANRPWTKAERDYVLANCPQHLLAPVAIGLYIGARQGDILRMSKRAYRDGWLRFTASKNRKRIEAPVAAGLARILARTPQHEATTLLVNSRLQPWTPDGFRASWGTWKKAAEKAGHVGPDLTFHGTRHTVATVLSEDGWENKDIGLALGQDSDAMPAHYSRRAKHVDRKQALAESVQKANEN
jgi:integrase